MFLKICTKWNDQSGSHMEILYGALRRIAGYYLLFVNNPSNSIINLTVIWDSHMKYYRGGGLSKNINIFPISIAKQDHYIICSLINHQSGSHMGRDFVKNIIYSPFH
jgi:hypothetical protein